MKPSLGYFIKKLNFSKHHLTLKNPNYLRKEECQLDLKKELVKELSLMIVNHTFVQYRYYEALARSYNQLYQRKI